MSTVKLPKHPDSSFTNDPMTRLWQNAHDRDTGAEAVEAVRARWQREREPAAAKQSGRLRRFLLGH